jgi:hypothetical protein
MPTTRPSGPYQVRDGLAVYRIGQGEPVLLMPAPHRFERPGLRAADVLIEGLAGQDRQVITFDPPGSGRSGRPTQLSMAEMHQCTDQALDALCGRHDPQYPPGCSEQLATHIQAAQLKGPRALRSSLR